MVESGWGRILFVSSESGLNIPREMIHYGMTKTAQLAITRGLLAAEGGRVFVENHPEGGAVFTMAVPTDTQPASPVNGAGV